MSTSAAMGFYIDGSVLFTFPLSDLHSELGSTSTHMATTLVHDKPGGTDSDSDWVSTDSSDVESCFNGGKPHTSLQHSGSAATVWHFGSPVKTIADQTFTAPVEVNPHGHQDSRKPEFGDCSPEYIRELVKFELLASRRQNASIYAIYEGVHAIGLTPATDFPLQPDAPTTKNSTRPKSSSSNNARTTKRPKRISLTALCCTLGFFSCFSTVPFQTYPG
ncbi:hypothetical protein EJ08DRAFT_659408 [Tothia fuscella]|uniref:Uncharacterized protein n=1 Tax=Tothia fuscella TaxID=1048955 RepID=A0A9P4NUQ4_9PEZI|nr:hypothetical protein EJ08DRAFT_659408 [Tothia fuscella]